MFAPKSLPLSKQTASRLFKVVTGLAQSHSIVGTSSHLWCGCFASQHLSSARNFSATSAARIPAGSPVAQGVNLNLKQESAWQK